MPAKSVKQQRFMGMVHAAKKGTLKNPSPEVARTAKSMTDEDAKDFASTKHKGLPEKVAYDLLNNSCEKIGEIASDRVHDGLEVSRAIAGCLVPTTELEKIGKLNYLHREEAVKFTTKLAYMMPAPRTHSTSKVLASRTIPSTTPKVPTIGQRRVTEAAKPAPPAAADAQAASKAMQPGVVKTAAGCKQAPRYSGAGKKGKKVMPQPHARQLKKPGQAFAEKMAYGTDVPLAATGSQMAPAGGGLDLQALLSQFLARRTGVDNTPGDAAVDAAQMTAP